MDGALVILFTTLVIYIPLAGILLYVWWKFGKNEKGVFISRLVFLFGSAMLFIYMLVI